MTCAGTAACPRCAGTSSPRRTGRSSASSSTPIVDGVRSGSLVTRRAGGALALAGEVDISNLELFSAEPAGGHAGRRIPSRGSISVTCGSWTSPRAGPWREPRSGSAYAGGGLLLVDPLPPVAHVLTLLGVGALPGVELVTR